VEATLPFLSRQVKAMVELQLLTGMRPREVCAMRSRNIDPRGEVWIYRPLQHKNTHHGHNESCSSGRARRRSFGHF
jgi:integrase